MERAIFGKQIFSPMGWVTRPIVPKIQALPKLGWPPNPGILSDLAHKSASLHSLITLLKRTRSITFKPVPATPAWDVCDMTLLDGATRKLRTLRNLSVRDTDPTLADPSSYRISFGVRPHVIAETSVWRKWRSVLESSAACQNLRLPGNDNRLPRAWTRSPSSPEATSWQVSWNSVEQQPQEKHEHLQCCVALPSHEEWS